MLLVVTSPNLENYEKQINKICKDTNYWFKLNQLVLNYNKTPYLQFNTKNRREYVLKPTFRETMSKVYHMQNLRFDHWWFPLMKGSYRPSDVQIKYNVLCNLTDKSYNVYWNFKNGLFCVRTFNYKLWNNILGNQPYIEKIFKIQKRVIRIITNLRMEIHTGKCFKVWKYYPYTHNIFSLYQYS